MTVILDLPPEVETKMSLEARQNGQALDDYLLTIIKERVELDKSHPIYSEQRKKNQAAIDMLNEWDEEDATDDATEIARRKREWEEFKKGMNAAHTSNRVIYP